MPILELTELNAVVAILGCFFVLYGLVSAKIKGTWYLGEALPALVVGIILGPAAGKLLNTERWGSAHSGQTSTITVGIMRVIIGLQLVISGFQLPARYQLRRWREMCICLLPTMTIMWLCTTLCMLATIPKATLLATLVIASCVTCIDPVLSQSIAKGAFAAKYVRREMREIISSEAGANDGFGFPFLMVVTYLIRHSEVNEADGHGPAVRSLGLVGREEVIGRIGGGVGEAMKNWFLETWLYTIILSIVYGVIVGYAAGKAIKFALRRTWIDNESYLLFPTALGLLIVGTCGAIGTDDLLACFAAGNALNWDAAYLAETTRRHDEVNTCVDVLLNLGGFMYIGAIMPWSEFHQPDTTGLTYGRLVGLGFLVLLFRRIPAVFLTYRLMPRVCRDWKEALFMGYFGPIGAGAVFYLEHTRLHLFPPLEQGDEEETNLIAAIHPVVMWLVLFSIMVHGLSIPALDIIYRFMGVRSLDEDGAGEGNTSNRFFNPGFEESSLPVVEGQPFAVQRAGLSGVVVDEKRTMPRRWSNGFGKGQVDGWKP